MNGILAFFLVTGGLGWGLFLHGGGADGLVWASGTGMVAAALLNGATFATVSRRNARRRSYPPGLRS